MGSSLPSFLPPFFSSYVFKKVPCSPDWSQSFDIVKADLELRDLHVLNAGIIDSTMSPVFHSAEYLTQGFVCTRKVLYPLSYIPNPYFQLFIVF